MTRYYQEPDRILSKDLQSRINSEYSQRKGIAPKNSIDPYRMACYKIIGRCDLANKTLDNVSSGIEDWIWLHFVLAREVDKTEISASEVFGLDDVRTIFKDIGQKHFSKGTDDVGGAATFFYMQILAGMFENAIAYLYPHSYMSAVHFAIALEYYGLLRASDFQTSGMELRKSFLFLPICCPFTDPVSDIQHQAPTPNKLWPHARLLYTRLPFRIGFNRC